MADQNKKSDDGLLKTELTRENAASGDAGRGRATGRRGRTTGRTGRATGRTGRAAGVTGQAAGVTGQAAGVTGQAAGVTGQAAGVTGQAAGVTGQAAGVTGQAACRPCQHSVLHGSRMNTQYHVDVADDPEDKFAVSPPHLTNLRDVVVGGGTLPFQRIPGVRQPSLLNLPPMPPIVIRSRQGWSQAFQRMEMEERAAELEAAELEMEERAAELEMEERAVELEMEERAAELPQRRSLSRSSPFLIAILVLLVAIIVLSIPITIFIVFILQMKKNSAEGTAATESGPPTSPSLD